MNESAHAVDARDMGSASRGRVDVNVAVASRARAHLVSHRAHAHSATPVWDSTRTTAAGASAHVPHITSGMTRERSFEVVRGRLCVCRSAARGRAASRRVPRALRRVMIGRSTHSKTHTESDPKRAADAFPRVSVDG